MNKVKNWKECLEHVSLKKILMLPSQVRCENFKSTLSRIIVNKSSSELSSISMSSYPCMPRYKDYNSMKLI